MLLGILTVFTLPDRPESTTFLTESERKIALERMNRSTSGDKGAVVQKGNTDDPNLPFRKLIRLVSPCLCGSSRLEGVCIAPSGQSTVLT